jgi:hypothetical protein
MKKTLNNVSAMALPRFYVSSAVKFVYKKGEKNDRTSDKVRSDNRQSS